MLSQSLTAQQKVSKKVTENFSLTNAGELHLDNKYGDVKLYGWDNDKISIAIDITVTHRKKEVGEELLSRINPKIKNAKDFVTVNYEIAEKSAGFFSRYFNKANPFDSDKSNVQINYTIYLPKNAELDISNKFGDLFIEDWKGKLKADVQHGDIWINEDLNNADIDIMYGKLRAKAVNYANIRVKNGSLDLKNSNDLRITSAGTDIRIEKVSSLEIYSSKDEISIGEVRTIYGNLKFTGLEIERLQSSVDITMKIADFRISEILEPNADIAIDQESSEISLNISNFDFSFDATLEEGLLRLPKSFKNVDSKMIDKGKRIREITATHGNNLSGKISISGKKGAILLKEL